jgi:hypothetical protein
MAYHIARSGRGEAKVFFVFVKVAFVAWRRFVCSDSTAIASVAQSASLTATTVTACTVNSVQNMLLQRFGASVRAVLEIFSFLRFKISLNTIFWRSKKCDIYLTAELLLSGSF